LLEISKQKELERVEMQAEGARGLAYQRPKMTVVVKRVMKGIMLNPIIIMTALGICGNLAFSHNVPKILEGILSVLKTIEIHCTYSFLNDAIDILLDVGIRFLRLSSVFSWINHGWQHCKSQRFGILGTWDIN
jgi:hypothetical protein